MIMGESIKDNKLVIITEPETVYFDFLENNNNNLKPETDFIVEQKEFLAVLTAKPRLFSYCPNIILETISMKTENSKTVGPHECVLNLPQRLDLRCLNKHVAI